MAIVRYIVALIFFWFGSEAFGEFRIFKKPALLAASAVYWLSGFASLLLQSWWPLPIGFALVWGLRLLGADPTWPVRKLDPPQLPIDHLDDSEAVNRYLNWGLEHDEHVGALRAHSTKEMWKEGARPKDFSSPVPVSSLEEYFQYKMAIDLKSLLNAQKAVFHSFVERTDLLSTEALGATGVLWDKYAMNPKRFRYEREIAKIRSDLERERFKVNLMTDTLLAAEVRALGWLYHEYFGEWYERSQPPTPAEIEKEFIEKIGRPPDLVLLC